MAAADPFTEPSAPPDPAGAPAAGAAQQPAAVPEPGRESGPDFLDRIHPERAVVGFTRLDGTVTFYNFVHAVMQQAAAARVMDFGAGRGAWHDVDPPWKRRLQDLRSGGAEVWACDVDPVVRTHPASHHQVVLSAGQRLPFEDGFFDVIVSDMTFEHIEEPGPVAAELLRVLRPGGVICARTPNRLGYAKLLAGLVPNGLHARVLRRVQPDRQERDVFPTYFRLNSVAQVRRWFVGCDVAWFHNSAEPSYYFGNAVLYRLLLVLHRLLPDALATSTCFIVRKP
jgi:SAM-dependent methyltransferase